MAMSLSNIFNSGGSEDISKCFTNDIFSVPKWKTTLNTSKFKLFISEVVSWIPYIIKTNKAMSILYLLSKMKVYMLQRWRLQTKKISSSVWYIMKCIYDKTNEFYQSSKRISQYKQETINWVLQKTKESKASPSICLMRLLLRLRVFHKTYSTC